MFRLVQLYYGTTKQSKIFRYLVLGGEFIGRDDGDMLEELIVEQRSASRSAGVEIYVFFFEYGKQEEEKELWTLWEELLNYMNETGVSRCIMVKTCLLYTYQYQMCIFQVPDVLLT